MRGAQAAGYTIVSLSLFLDGVRRYMAPNLSTGARGTRLFGLDGCKRLRRAFQYTYTPILVELQGVPRN